MTAPSAAPGTSASRAAELYDDTYAERYRRHDDELAASAPSMALAEWLAHVCEACGRGLTALELGCGTGRYFWALRGIRTVVGVDASAAMLARARAPHRAAEIAADRVLLVRGDIESMAFAARRFDLVYAIGVLAEHAPLTEQIVASVGAWLKPGGRFAFTAVRPDSPSVPRTASRRAASWIASRVPGALASPLRDRLLTGGMYADRDRITELLSDRFVIESLAPFESEAHLHWLCVARRGGSE